MNITKPFNILYFFEKYDRQYSINTTPTPNCLICVLYFLYKPKFFNFYYFYTKNPLPLKFKKLYLYKGVFIKFFLNQKNAPNNIPATSLYFNIFLNKIFLIKQYLACRLSKYFYFRIYKLLFGYASYILSKLTFFKNFYMFIKLSSLPQFKFHKYFDIFLRYKFIFERHATLQKNVFEVFYSAFKYKNLKFLIIWMKLLFKQVNFYKHRYLLYFFRYLFKYLENGLFHIFKIRGFYMKFHGKIAKAGNSRKQKFLIKYQSVSTSYSTNYVVEKFQINTFTGVIGVSLILNF